MIDLILDLKLGNMIEKEFEVIWDMFERMSWGKRNKVLRKF